MVSRKRKFWTVLLIFLLAALIVGGVFGISYYKGGVTFPWEVTTGQSEDETSQVVQEPEEPVVQEKPEPAKPEPVVEQEPEEKEEEPREENLQMLTSGKLDYFGPLHVQHMDTTLSVKEVTETGITLGEYTYNDNNIEWSNEQQIGFDFK